MLAFDVTPTTAKPCEEKRGREETAVDRNFEKRRRTFVETLFVGFLGEVPSLRRQSDSTATAEEVRATQHQRARPPVVDDDEALKARDVRLALLARKYEGAASIEDTARLQILTERLRKLAPRVTDEDVEQVAEMVSDAEGIAKRLSAVKEKFGLR